MPTKRQILDALTRDELLDILDDYQLEVADRRKKDLLLDAVAGSKRARAAEFLEQLPRDRLKELCRGLGLDDSGRAKADIVARLLGQDGKPAQRSLFGQEPGTLASAAPEGDGSAKTAAPKRGRAKRQSKAAKKNGGDLGFEATLWAAADKLRNNMDAAEYKHVVLGLIFLKYISDAFEERYRQLQAEVDEGADPEDPDEYRAEGVFWVPPEARWQKVEANAKRPEIGKVIDDAMTAIEQQNPTLRGVLSKNYARPQLDKHRLGELIDLIATVGLGDAENRSKDILGRVYEYFLSEFASAEGKKGGQFYTPRSVVRLLVEMLAPYKGRVLDPCCGSGGMFVQSERFIEEHGGRVGDISIYGQESNPTTWRLAKMNLAIRGIDADLGEVNADSFHRDLHQDLKADFILANPPFNDSDWGGDRLREDVRWKYGVPPTGNANFAWVQNFIHHLGPRGTAGFVLANGSMSSQQSGEGDIRKAIVEADLVDCMVALPPQLFYSTAIPACLWFVARDKSGGSRLRHRKGEVLFVDARKFGAMVDRTHRELTDKEVARIVESYHAWRGDRNCPEYEDVAGFCFSARLSDIEKHEFVLTPGRFVGAEDEDTDEEPFQQKLARLVVQLRAQVEQARKLDDEILRSSQGFGHE